MDTKKLPHIVNNKIIRYIENLYKIEILCTNKC